MSIFGTIGFLDPFLETMLGIQKASGNSLAVQWLGFQASTAGGVDLILVLGTKIPHAVRCSRKREKQNRIYAELL